MGCAVTEADRLARNADIPLELAQLVVVAANQADMPLRNLRSARQHRELVQVRRTVVLAARHRNPPFSYWQIGRALNRDHSTVIWAERGDRGRRSRPQWMDQQGGA